MDLRQFCQVRTYPYTVLTTYSFDPLFFERVVLADLKSGGSKHVTVLADAEQALSSINAAHDQLFMLGKRYAVIPIHLKGAFHPKLCLRMSPTGCLFSCSSANLTRSGWLGRPISGSGPGNREITTLRNVTKDSDSVSGINRICRDLIDCVDLAEDRKRLYECFDQPWMNLNQVGNDQPSTLLSGQTESLASHLETRWQNRRFDRLHIISGSTDAHGGMLKWASSTFGIKEAHIHMDQRSCGFEPDKIRNLDIDLRFHLAKKAPHTHLKLFFFESDQGYSSAVCGSANCSNAAWLLSRPLGGNIEAVTIYDSFDEETFKPFIREDVPESTLETYEPVAMTVEDEKSSESGDQRLMRVDIDLSTDQVIAYFLNVFESDVNLRLVIEDTEITLKKHPHHSYWAGHLPINLQEKSVTTRFAYARFGPESDTAEMTNWIWVNDLRSLDRLSVNSNLTDPIKKFRNPGTKREYDRLLNDVRAVSSCLIKGDSSLSDPTEDQVEKARPGHSKSKTAQIDSKTFIRSLSDLQKQRHNAGKHRSPSEQLSLSGIFRMLYQNIPQDASDDDDVLDQEYEQDTSESSNTPNDDLPPQEDVPTEKQCAKLINQIQRFVRQFSKPSYKNACSARQLQECIAFPMALIHVILSGPWSDVVDFSEIRKLTEEVLEASFIRNYQRTDPKTKARTTVLPIAVEVRNRYEADGRLDIFNEVMGDGQLWFLITTIFDDLKDADFDPFRRSLLLHSMTTTEVLINSTTPEYLMPLIEQFNKSTNSDYVSEINQLVDAHEQLNQYLTDTYTPARDHYAPKSPSVMEWLWNEGVGFAQIRTLDQGRKGCVHIYSRAATRYNINLDYYVNLSQHRIEDAELDRLMKLCCT